MLEFHSRLAGTLQGRSGNTLNWPAGVLQWAWFFAYGNPLVGGLIGSVGVVIAAIFALPADDPLEAGLYAYFLTWLVLVLPCAFYADHLAYGKLAGTIGTMQLDSPALVAAARKNALNRSIPNPLMVMLSLVFPLVLLFSLMLALDAQKEVQAKIGTAIALKGLRDDIVRYETANGIAPSDSDLQLPALHAHEIQSIKVTRGVILVTLAIEQVQGQRMIWRRVADTKGGMHWQCEPDDVPSKYVPPGCKR